jgi:hypothetical protein
MESPANLPRRGLILILLGLGITVTAERTIAQCPNRGTVADDEVSNSKGKPYQAKEIQTIVTYGSDGTKHVVVSKSNLFRDSKGRVRVERYYDGTDDPSEIVPSDILIDDNCGTSVNLVPAWKTAKISKWVPPVKVSERPSCEEIDLKNPPQTGPQGKFEDLGHKLIDGVEVRGERISYYSSAQAKLSGAPPVRVFENWCSISLDTLMGDYILDDRPKREITTVISDIKQIEPEPELFEIPEGYKIIRADQSAPASSAMGSASGPKSLPCKP